MAKNDLRLMRVARVYPAYVAKAERKARSRTEVDAILCWLTGHDQHGLEQALVADPSFADFFAQAPRLNPARLTVTGSICGIRVETIEDPVVRDVRILDKLIDELAKGRPMAKILRD